MQYISLQLSIFQLYTVETNV